MSIQWMFIACCLYTEITIVLILMLPIASPKRWTRLFRSRLFYYFQSHVAIYFTVILSIMALLLFDSIREMRKYSTSSDASHAHLAAELKGHVKLFRAQRNFYITGFSIFLVFVIRRFVTMIIEQADMQDRTEQATGHSREVTRTVNETLLGQNIVEAGVANFKQLQEDLAQREETLQSKELIINNMTHEIDTWKRKYQELAHQNLAQGTGDNINNLLD